jgi:hypothetical protein
MNQGATTERKAVVAMFRRLLREGCQLDRVELVRREDGSRYAINVGDGAVPAHHAEHPEEAILDELVLQYMKEILRDGSRGGLWQFTDHVCSECAGRILERMDGPAGVFRCTSCGAEGTSVESICACGCRLDPNVDSGFRCARNPKQTSDNPEEIVVEAMPPAEFKEREWRQPALPIRVPREE